MRVGKWNVWTMTTMIRRYSELRRLETFDERLEYLRLQGSVGYATFGFDRYLNQRFYTSYEWKMARQTVILRDNGCDLGVRGYEIHADMLIHHLNPVTVDDIQHGEEWIFDPEYLITTTQKTHNAIHYGGDSHGPAIVTQRQVGDTRLW